MIVKKTTARCCFVDHCFRWQSVEAIERESFEFTRSRVAPDRKCPALDDLVFGVIRDRWVGLDSRMVMFVGWCIEYTLRHDEVTSLGVFLLGRALGSPKSQSSRAVS